VRSLELFVPGFADLLATLLEAYAADVRSGVAFAHLSPDERRQVLRTMAKEESPDMRDVIDGLFVLTYGGMYSEWTGYDRATGRLSPPRAWARLGFGGPSEGHAGYREGI